MKFALKAAVAVTALFAASAANADTIDWTQWDPSTTVISSSTGGVQDGTIAGGINVRYTGEVESLSIAYPSWLPISSYTGGTIGDAPPALGNTIRIFGGGSTGTNTISFSSALINPVLAIWSLGEPGYTTEFDFGQPFTIQAGGPSLEYASIGATGLTSAGNNVYGVEGNGVIQFTGTYSSITFTNPTAENWYGFTVGNDIGAVPEPATWAMFLLGFGAVGFAMRSSRRNAKAVTA